jgi:hypothetical protein
MSAASYNPESETAGRSQVLGGDELRFRYSRSSADAEIV